MPRYFFQITENKNTARPEIPVEFSDVESAWEEATTACGELLRDLDGSLVAGTDWTIEVQGEDRKTLRSITVSATIHQ
jgi:hypothetical protein